jgi:hypothetical protein
MFSTFARILDLGREHALSNPNQRAPNAGHVVHHGRPRLVCRWVPDPTSRKPLCRWEIDGGEGASSAKPARGRRRIKCLPSWPSVKRVAWPCERLNPEQGVIWTRGLAKLDLAPPGFQAPQREPRWGPRANLEWP